jgi:hypothetical protein
MLQQLKDLGLELVVADLRLVSLRVSELAFLDVECVQCVF